MKTDKGQKPIHMVVLFPTIVDRGKYKEEVTTKYLEDNFLSKINCTDSVITQYGEGDYARGLLEIQVDFEETCKLARSLGGITIVHNGSKDGGFDRGLSHAKTPTPTHEDIISSFDALKGKLMIECVDICEIPNNSESNLRTKQFYLDTFNKPCIISSDSHSQYEGKKYSWIKAEPTIEGLRQVIYEPKHRVHLGEYSPVDPVHKINIVKMNFPETTKIVGEDFCVRGDLEIPFSPNLTCFIGGRGSGKSTILNLIHEKLKPGENLFFKKFKLENLPKEKEIGDYIQIDDNDDEKFIEFLSQNEIEDFAINYEKFTTSLFPRLLKVSESARYIELNNQLGKYIESIDEKKDCLVKQFKLQVQKKSNEKQKKTFENIVNSLKDETYTLLNMKIKDTDKEIKQIKKSKESFVNYVKEIENINSSYVVDSSNMINNIYEKKKDEMIKSISKVVDEYSKDDNFTIINDRLNALEDQLLTERQSINEYLTSKGLTGENLADVASATQEVNKYDALIREDGENIDILQERIDTFIQNDTLKDQLIDEINGMIQNLNLSLMNLSEHVKPIEVSFSFDFEKAKKEILNAMKVSFEKFDYFNNIKMSDIEKYLFCVEPNEINDFDIYLTALQAVGIKSKTFNALNEYFSVPIRFAIFKLIIKKNLMDVDSYKTLKVQYDGKKLENTSFGQRCTAAIVLLLKLGNNPIIIDEPEAHLDGTVIAEYLVDLIKENKQNRQIIFSTHNANFAINGDAELINILDVSELNKTQITSTSIEDIENRDKLLRLEGGKLAFENREKKYQF
ncbi:TrlF family AAA-like ATPase [Paenibacillus sp. W2I17]|uniref:TrlF family AAA-like ATPase n=1 Tax=Paenibacillus sp. W2I17 TaxID=3042311 RepID=UPI00277D4FC5|nr:hypothetical protein [Paenibacillus sp. W2I17]MDQ0660599.1 exonuclease SbcC [Paenibacillus sp. W2I17]